MAKKPSDFPRDRNFDKSEFIATLQKRDEWTVVPKERGAVINIDGVDDDLEITTEGAFVDEKQGKIFCIESRTGQIAAVLATVGIHKILVEWRILFVERGERYEANDGRVYTFDDDDDFVMDRDIGRLVTTWNNYDDLLEKLDSVHAGYELILPRVH